MVMIRVTIAVMWICSLLFARAVWSSSIHASWSAPTSAVASPDSRSLSHRLETVPERQDRYGNEISSAVGEYGVDAGGRLYERHAPETDVPNLAAPTT